MRERNCWWLLLLTCCSVISCRSDTGAEQEKGSQLTTDTLELTADLPQFEPSANPNKEQSSDVSVTRVRNATNRAQTQTSTKADAETKETPSEYEEEPRREDDDQIFVDPKELNIDFLPNQLSYIYWDEQTAAPLPYRPKLSQHVNIKRVVEYGENDRPPAFSGKCLDKTNILQCSRQAVQAYIDKQIDHRLLEQQGQPKGVQYITFILDKQGNIQGNIRAVRSGDRTCRLCAMEAIRLVREMPAWQPAKLNGQVVSVRAVLPVHYRPAGN